MEIRHYIYILLAILLSFASMFFYLKANQFRTVHIRGDLTSSGGNRTIAADLYFKDVQLVSGFASTTLTEGQQNARHEVTHVCIFKNGEWKESSGSDCATPLYTLPTSLDEFNKQKADGTVKPAGDHCRHLDICYTTEKK